MREDFSAFQIKHKPTDTKEAWIIMVPQTVITQKRRKSYPLKPNALSRLVPPLHMQILHHPLPPTRSRQPVSAAASATRPATSTPSCPPGVYFF
jgi:hypothetical protein